MIMKFYIKRCAQIEIPEDVATSINESFSSPFLFFTFFPEAAKIQFTPPHKNQPHFVDRRQSITLSTRVHKISLLKFDQTLRTLFLITRSKQENFTKI